MKKYVITGGPGIGKTTLIEILASKGYMVVPETARIIIEEEILKKSDCLPWLNLKLFQQEVAQRQIEAELKVTGDTVFLDRGIVDGYGYCMLGKITPPELIMSHGKNRYEKIFLLDPLPIYKKDESRIEDEQTARNIHEAIEYAYKYFRYETVTVPVMTPEERFNFIMKQVSG